MDARDPLGFYVAPPAARGGASRHVWQAVAMLTAGALAWLIFAAYRQPDFILDFAALRLC